MLAPTNADGDSGKQITDVRSLIGAGAKGLIVVANDSKAIIPALDFAGEQKVPVVSIDIGPDGGSLYAIVRADNTGMGWIACFQDTEHNMMGFYQPGSAAQAAAKKSATKKAVKKKPAGKKAKKAAKK